MDLWLPGKIIQNYFVQCSFDTDIRTKYKEMATILKAFIEVGQLALAEIGRHKSLTLPKLVPQDKPRVFIGYRNSPGGQPLL